ncbi:unnamed protein product, partial [Cyprideis torosa]
MEKVSLPESHRAFLLRRLSPCVLVMASADADAVCLKNNLTFAELLQPFSQMLGFEAMLADPTSTEHRSSTGGSSLKSTRVTDPWVQFIDQHWRIPPEQHLGSKFLSEVVAERCQNVVNSSHNADRISMTILPPSSTEPYTVSIPSTTPWYDGWKDLLFQFIPPADHEFQRHMLAVLFVVSSSHPDAYNQLMQLTTMQNELQHTLSPSATHLKWFSPSLLKHFVVLHDLSSEVEMSTAQSLYDHIKSQFSATMCHLITLNEAPPPETEATPPALTSFFEPFIASHMLASRASAAAGSGADSTSSPITPMMTDSGLGSTSFPSAVREGTE